MPPGEVKVERQVIFINSFASLYFLFAAISPTNANIMPRLLDREEGEEREESLRRCERTERSVKLIHAHVENEDFFRNYRFLLRSGGMGPRG